MELDYGRGRFLRYQQEKKLPFRGEDREGIASAMPQVLCYRSPFRARGLVFQFSRSPKPGSNSLLFRLRWVWLLRLLRSRIHPILAKAKSLSLRPLLAILLLLLILQIPL